MTPDRTAALEQAVGKLANLLREHIQEQAWCFAPGSNDRHTLLGKADEAAEIARQFSQPEVNRET